MLTRVLLPCALAVSACAIDDLAPGEGGDSLITVNSLSSNRLSLNRLSLNRLSLNRLSLNRLSLNSAAAGELTATADGRDLLSYVVRCALPENLSLVFTVDSVTYEYFGLLGLAPSWEQTPLTDRQRASVSACLLAHVNAFGVAVPVSLRASGLPVPSDEKLIYGLYEATFFGDVFGGDRLLMYACTGTPADEALARSADRALRVCADRGPDGKSLCGFDALGDCTAVCERIYDDKGASDCSAPGGALYPATVSSWLWEPSVPPPVPPPPDADADQLRELTADR